MSETLTKVVLPGIVLEKTYNKRKTFFFPVMPLFFQEEAKGILMNWRQLEVVYKDEVQR